MLLVGDSVGMVVHGLPNTVGVTLEMMILHGQAVMRASKKAMVVVDMPFGSYEGTPERAYDNASRIMKETGAQGVKVEAGPTVPDTIEHLVKRGIPVMGHVGLRPQSVLVDGGFKAKGRTNEERSRIIYEAKAAAGAGASVTAAVPAAAAARFSPRALAISSTLVVGLAPPVRISVMRTVDSRWRWPLRRS